MIRGGRPIARRRDRSARGGLPARWSWQRRRAPRRTPATSRARNSVSTWVRSATRRSSSVCTRSRCSCRFWASRISGAAYAACSDSSSVNSCNCWPSNGLDLVEPDPQGDEHALEHQEACGAERAGDGLAELAERLGVVVHAEPPALAWCGEVFVALHRRTAPVLTRLRWRHPVGSVRSSTSSTVIAPSSRPASSHTPRASML